MRKEVRLTDPIDMTEFVGTDIWIRPVSQIHQRAILVNFNQLGVFVNMKDQPSYRIKFYPWTNIRSLEMIRKEEEDE